MSATFWGYVEATDAASVIVSIKAALIAAGWTDLEVSGRDVLESAESVDENQCVVELSVDSTLVKVEAGNSFSGTAFVGTTIVRRTQGTGGSLASNRLFAAPTWFLYLGSADDDSPAYNDSILGAGVINPLNTQDTNTFWVVGNYLSASGPFDVSLTGTSGDYGIAYLMGDDTLAEYGVPLLSLSQQVPPTGPGGGVLTGKYWANAVATDTERAWKGTIDDMVGAVGLGLTSANYPYGAVSIGGSYYISLDGLGKNAQVARAGKAIMINVGTSYISDWEFWDILS